MKHIFIYLISLVCKAVGPLQSVVESYGSYEWTQVLSSRQSKLSSGKMHLIRET